MGRAALFIVPLVFAVYALIDCFQASRSRIRGLSKAAWFFVILIPMLGPIAWGLFGRPVRTKRIPTGLAPDDNPEFLRQLRVQRQLDERRRQRENKPPKDPNAGPTPGSSTGPTGSPA